MATISLIGIVSTPEQWARGLQGVPKLDPGTGMLFVYPTPRMVHFWMFNTLVPLDIIFVDGSGIVTRIAENLQPHDLNQVSSESECQFALEVPAGTAAAAGILPGMRMIAPPDMGVVDFIS